MTWTIPKLLQKQIQPYNTGINVPTHQCARAEIRGRIEAFNETEKLMRKDLLEARKEREARRKPDGTAEERDSYNQLMGRLKYLSEKLGEEGKT